MTLKYWQADFESGNLADYFTTFECIIVVPGLVGTYAAKIGDHPYGYYDYWNKTIIGIPEFYFNTKFKPIILSLVDISLDYIMSWSGGGGLLGRIGIGEDMLWRAYVGAPFGGTLVASSVPPNVVVNNTIISLELYVKIANSDGKIILWIDGIEVINYTGDTQPGAVTVVESLGAWVNFYRGYVYDNIIVSDSRIRSMFVSYI